MKLTERISLVLSWLTILGIIFVASMAKIANGAVILTVTGTPAANVNQAVEIQINTDADQVAVIPGNFDPRADGIVFGTLSKGRKVSFGSENPGVFIIAIAAFKAGEKPSTLRYQIVVGTAPTPAPTPVPTPVPTPKPNLTPTAKAIYDGVMLVVSTERSTTAATLAGIFRTQQAISAAGGGTPQALIDSTKAEIVKKIPAAELARWDKWQIVYIGVVGPLKTKADVEQAWLEIAAGLDAAK